MSEILESTVKQVCTVYGNDRTRLLGIFALLASLCFTSEIRAQVEVHSFLQAKAVVANNNYAQRIDRWGFRLQQKIDDEFDWLTEIYVHPYPDPVSTVSMESAYIN